MTAPRSPLRLPVRGTSLIEVLIAMLLLSVGMLGMVALKTASLKYTGQSNARAAASIYATDILDRMRANPVRAVPVGAKVGEYDLAINAAAPATPTTVAQVDLVQWRQRIADGLPGGTGSVAVTANSNVTVVVQWTERTDHAASPQTLSFTFEARL